MNTTPVVPCDAVVILSQIRGQPRAVGLLERALAAGRVAHAYLFCGPAHAGKYTTGLALAAALNCTLAPGKGCETTGRSPGQSCVACDKIAAGIHPDVQTLARQGAQQIIPIETIRTQVIPQLGMAPHEGMARVFLIEEAGALQGASANALLKTLEEPPQRTHFVLCTTSPEQILPTIRSRCQRVNFGALPPDMRAEIAEDREAAERLGATVAALHKAMNAADPESLYQAAAAAAREELGPVLDLMAARLHDEAKGAAMSHDLGRAALIGHRIEVILDARAALAQNAHGQITLEAMLQTLRSTV